MKKKRYLFVVTPSNPRRKVKPDKSLFMCKNVHERLNCTFYGFSTTRRRHVNLSELIKYGWYQFLGLQFECTSKQINNENKLQTIVHICVLLHFVIIVKSMNF